MLFIKAIARFHRQRQGRQIHLLSNLNILRRSIEKEYYFVRKNHKQIGEEIQILVERQQWDSLRRAISCINISELDSWLTLRKIAKSIQKTLNRRTHLKNMSQNQIQNMLSVLVLLNFQPILPNNSEVTHPYDQIDGFHQQLNEYVKQLNSVSINDNYFQLARNLIHTNPSLFSSKKEQFQHYVLSNIDYLGGKGYSLIDILARGAYSNFWTGEFKKEINQKLRAKGDLKSLKPLLFQDLDVPTKIEHPTHKFKMKIETDIINILEGYQYDIESNVLINDYEVDVLLGKTLVIEYNGHHHYVINSDQLVPTIKQSWKSKVLAKRGFMLSSIAYSEWKWLKLFEQKRLYLLNKVQSDLLGQYRERLQ